MGTLEDYSEANTILLGAPMDYTVSFRPGTRMGAQRIREVSYGVEEYSPYQDKDLVESKFYDAGEIFLPFGNVLGSLKNIKNAVAKVLKDDKFPLVMGGEHLVSLPIIQAMCEKYSDLAVVHFDAHADLRQDYLGECHSHATVMRQVAELIGGKNLYQFGIRSGTKDEFRFAKENTNFFPYEVLKPLGEVLPKLKGRAVYVSLDIDVVDPAYAPGTGTPEPGGCTSKEILQAIHLLAELQIVGFDLVEVSPVYDQSERTSLLAAKIIREAILAFRG